MPAYSLHRASLVHSGRFGVRAAAVAALLLASVTAAVVLTRGSSGPASTASATTKSSHAAVQPDRLVPAAAKAKAAPKTARAKVAKTTHAKVAAKAPVHAAAKIPAPVKTPVAVLNGGTSQGAAAATASKLRSYGYPVPLVGNAGRRDLPSAIEYTPGLGPAARALARKIGPVSYVTPLDGPARNLSGARLLVIIGS
jgi:hypothetical protein